MKNRRGFVLMETIVVISVLCVILVSLYGGYSTLITKAKKKSNYDNTEYIYKTAVLRKELEKIITANDLNDPNKYNTSRSYIAFCSRTAPGAFGCDSIYIENATIRSLMSSMNVQAIYFTDWNVWEVEDNFTDLEPTTQAYIRYVDDEPNEGKRIIVMYQNENGTDAEKDYQYASLLYGSRD